MDERIRVFFASKVTRAPHETKIFSKPNFIIVGAQKCGTSALFMSLGKHTVITPPLKKEIHYFDNDQWYCQNKINDYHSCFPTPQEKFKNNLFFEASPLYLYHPKVAERLFRYNADLKLIILLRDPALRALSAWTMYHHHFTEGPHVSLHDARTFDQAIREEMLELDHTNFYNNPIAYLRRGIYHDQIQEYFKYFPREQVLVLESEELRYDFENKFLLITEFLEVPYEEIENITINQSQVDNKSLYKVELEHLRELFQKYNSKLFSLIGREFDW